MSLPSVYGWDKDKKREKKMCPFLPHFYRIIRGIEGKGMARKISKRNLGVPERELKTTEIRPELAFAPTL